MRNSLGIYFDFAAQQGLCSEADVTLSFSRCVLKPPNRHN